VTDERHPGYEPIGPGAGPHNPFPDLHGRSADVVAKEQASDRELQARLVRPTCLFCGHDQFQEEIGKLDTRFGMEAHKVRMLICRRCSFTMQFSQGRGWNV
jgi:hypothetical protein